MTVASFLMASMLAASNPTDCPMRPPPLGMEAFKSSSDIKAYVADSPKSASILLKDGSLIRVMSMGCVDSGAVAQIILPSPPADNDIAAWRKTLSHLSKIAFGSYGDKVASWVSTAKLGRTEGFVLSASGGDNPQFEVTVQDTTYSMGYVVTMSYSYN
jgi:hypothetical protein